jgi:hypothetical protein
MGRHDPLQNIHSWLPDWLKRLTIPIDGKN